jgi:hypothetical protein
MKRVRRFSALIACFYLAAPAPARADVISDWNQIALTFIGTAIVGHPGPQSLLDAAIVQAAMHDAIQAYEHRFQPYARNIAVAAGSPVAAAARAARDVLVARLPLQETAINDRYLLYLSQNSLLPTDPGVAVGQDAADGVLDLRVNDGSFPVGFPQFNGANEIGVWRPTPPGFATMNAPWAGGVVPYTMTSTAGCQPAPLPALTSSEYAENYNEVKTFGSAGSTARSDEQDHLVRFYNENFITQLNRLARDVADAQQLDTGNRARLLALVNLSMADAFICAWESKRHFAFWRPITAIREGDNDGNPATAGDPTWTPAVTTPPYPDYTSGANNITAATTRILALYFGDHTTFRVTSLSPTLLATDATFIEYTRFSDVQKDVIDVRVWQGIHFRFADTEGRSQGRRVAQHAFKNFLQPIQ